ncbi:MAG: hypothetical protein F4X44_04355 [Gammaproteobacteria bacterium]|nr:hypothetical protein [Gammaproteobacteria bacterium]
MQDTTKEHEAQISEEMSRLSELSPHDRVRDRIFESVEHDKRRIKNVRNISIGTFLVVFTFIGIGYLMILQDSEDELKTNSQSSSLAESSSKDEPESFPALQPLSKILEIPSRFNRRSAMHRFVATSDAPALRDLLKQSEAIGNRQLREEVQEVVVLKLASLDEMDTIAYFEGMEDDRRSSLTKLVFQERSLLDLDDSIAFAEGLDALGRTAAMKGIADMREDLSMDRWNAIASRLVNQEEANNIRAVSMARVAIEDPDEALQSFLSNYGGELSEDAQIRLFEHISRALINKHGPRSALGRVDQAIGSSQYRGRVLNVFFDELRKDDPELAVQLAVEMSHGEDELVVGGVVLGWAFYDPMGALKATLSIQEVEQRNIALQAFPLSGAAENIPEQIIATLSNYPVEGTSSNEGVGLIIRRAVRALAKKSPEDAVRHFYLIPNEAERLELAKDVAKTWSRSDVRSALNWINTNDEVQELRQRLFPVAIRELVYEDPQLALQTALELETQDHGIGPEAGVIEELAKIDVETALGMLRNARNEETLLSAAQSIGRSLIQDGDSQRAMEIAKELPESSQEAYFESLLSNWVLNDGFGLFESFHRLPTTETRKAAARSLLTSQRSMNGIRLTEEQEEKVLSFLSEDELAEMQSSSDEPQDWEYVLF